MRNEYSNIIDNISSRLDKKIDKKILMETIQNYSPEDRDSKKYRNGLLKFGAYQMKNIQNVNYAMFGGSNGSKVGP